MLSDKDHDVVITISSSRTEDVSTGKAVKETKIYVVTDRYTENELNGLISQLTPVENSTI